MTKLLMVLMTISTGLLLQACSSSPKDAAADSKTAEATAAATQEAAKSKTATATTEAGKGVKCTLAKDMRGLEIKPTGKGCELNYTKFSETKVVSRSSVGMGHCEKSQEKIKANLEKAGFKCE